MKGLPETLARVVASVPDTVTFSRDLLQWFAVAKQEVTGAPALLHSLIYHDPLLQNRYVGYDGSPDPERRLAFRYAVWVLWRAQRYGVEQALQELEALRTAPFLGYHSVIVLRQLAVTGAQDFGRGVTLLPWDEVPLTGMKEEFTWHRNALATSTNGHAALLYRYQQRNLPSGTAEDFAEVGRQRYGSVPRLLDALAAMTFATDVTVVPVALYTEQDEDLPTDGGWSPFRVNDPDVGVMWPIDRNDLTRSLNLELGDLTPEFRRVILALSNHLASATRAANDPAEACSQLGIALETAFLAEEESSEILYRLSTRAARYVGGTDLASRRAFRKTLKDFYDLRSKAVHRGRLTEKQMRGNNHAKVIKAAAETVRLAARRAIADRRFPTWSDFDLDDAPVPLTKSQMGTAIPQSLATTNLKRQR